MIEDADPHTSVTFVHVACSGGRIHRALLESYDGIVFEPEDEPLRAQIDRVAELADDHEIDALFVSIGGNDINFSKVVEACVLGEVCHLGDPMIDPLLEKTASLVCGLLGSYEDECKSYLDPDVIDVDSLDARTIFEIGSKDEYVDDVDVHQDGLDDLPANYDDLGQAIVGSLGMDPARVYLTEIPDVTRDEFGDLCAWPTELPAITEMEWASNYVLTELRAAMQAAANKHGWQFVDSVDPRFAGHGYCSDVTWLTRLQNTFQFQGDQNGALHPNVGGSYRSTFDLPGGCEVGRAVFEDDRDPVGSDESDSDARIKAGVDRSVAIDARGAEGGGAYGKLSRREDQRRANGEVRLGAAVRMLRTSDQGCTKHEERGDRDHADLVGTLEAPRLNEDREVPRNAEPWKAPGEPADPESSDG
jgi:hypothetical protein